MALNVAVVEIAPAIKGTLSSWQHATHRRGKLRRDGGRKAQEVAVIPSISSR